MATLSMSELATTDVAQSDASRESAAGAETHPV